jgi:hypothetical protein
MFVLEEFLVTDDQLLESFDRFCHLPLSNVQID